MGNLRDPDLDFIDFLLIWGIPLGVTLGTAWMEICVFLCENVELGLGTCFFCSLMCDGSSVDV